MLTLRLLLLLCGCLFIFAAFAGVAGSIQDTNRPLADIIGFTGIGVSATAFVVFGLVILWGR